MRMPVSDTAAILRRLRIKRESGENPEQSRCCDVRSALCGTRSRRFMPLPPMCGREGVATGTSQKTCRQRKIATCEGQDKSGSAATTHRFPDSVAPYRICFRSVYPPVRATAIAIGAKQHLFLIITAMKTTIMGAAYHAPAIRELSVSLEEGFATSAFSGSTGNENYGYENENWD